MKSAVQGRQMERFARIMDMLFLIGCSTEADFRGGIYVRDNIEERACELANFIIENSSTVRATAQKFGISKSTVHKDLTERLSYVNKPLYLEVKELLEYNKSQRHIRGGIATRKKYKGE